MTRQEAEAALRRLALGLPADAAGVRKILERISLADDAEALRAYLTEQGCRVVLEEAQC